MSELKVIDLGNIRESIEKDEPVYYEYYAKSEADKVIAHNKYKRCLAMARWCCDAYDKWMMRKAKAIGLGMDGVKEYHRARRKLFHYMRWQKRWLELAEKFKEAK